MAGIFISYRRDDSDVAAGRLADDLSAIFGPDSIFRDVDSLYPGQDYEEALDYALASCAVLLAIIGPRWSTITTKEGQRRLEDPTDWVCAEISRALARGIHVIPILISGTNMPRDTEVPIDLKPLLKRQGFELDDRHWKQQVAVLAQALEKVPAMTSRALLPAATNRTRLRYVGASVAVVFLIACVVAFNGILRRPQDEPRPGPGLARDVRSKPNDNGSINISGTWKIESQKPIPLCAFTQVGNNLTGSCTGPKAVGALTGMIVGKQVRWTWQWKGDGGDQGVFNFVGTLVSDDTITGKVERSEIGLLLDFKAIKQ